MKKACALLAVLFIIFTVAACAKKSQNNSNAAVELAKPFESTITVHYKDINAVVKLAKRQPGYCRLSFTAPEALKDMTVEFTLDKVNIDYKTLRTSFNPSTIPGSALSKMLVSAIDKATKEDGVRIEYKDDIMLISGKLEGEGSEFILRIDRNNGNIIRLSVPADDFEAEFLDFNFIAQ